MRAWMLTRGGLVVVSTLIVYVALAPSWILGGDNAEFAMLGARGGAAHPSGYPLYVLYLRAMAWLPGTPAHAAAVATALLGAAQIGVLHAACRAWGARPAAASIACAVYAGGPLPLLLHTQAEVFALNGLVVAAIVWLAADEGPRRGLARVGSLGLVAGLGLANHQSCVLIAPLGLVGAVRGVRESGRIAAAVAIGVAGLAAGLLPYLYLFAVHNQPGTWADIRSLDALTHHVLRRDYGTFQLGSTAAEVPLADQLGALGASLGRGWLWIGLPLAAWGFAQRRATHVALALSFVLAGPVFAAISNVPLEEPGRTVVERFHLLPVMLLVVPVALGLERLARRRAHLPEGGLTALAIVALAGSAGASVRDVRAAQGPQIEHYLRNTLEGLPLRAVLFGSGDAEDFGVAYLQRARGVRGDVVYLDGNMLWFPWYRAQLSSRLGMPIEVEPSEQDDRPRSVRFAEQLLAAGRPVFVNGAGAPGTFQANLVAAFPGYPAGTVIRLLPRGRKLPPIDDVEAENLALLERYTPRGPPPEPVAVWARAMYPGYAAPWRVLAASYTSLGRAEDAARCAAIADALSR